MTDDTIHSLAVRIQELEKQVNLHVKYQEDAVQLAAAELKDRLRRDEVIPQVKRLTDDISRLQVAYSELQGRLWAFGVIAVAVSSVIGFFFR